MSPTLAQVILETPMLDEGGTLEVMLGIHALQRGYRAKLHTFNLRILDPTWFEDGVDIQAKLEAQSAARTEPKLRVASSAYLDFMRMGGKVYFEDLTSSVLRRRKPSVERKKLEKTVWMPSTSRIEPGIT